MNWKKIALSATVVLGIGGFGMEATHAATVGISTIQPRHEITSPQQVATDNPVVTKHQSNDIIQKKRLLTSTVRTFASLQAVIDDYTARQISLPVENGAFAATAKVKTPKQPKRLPKGLNAADIILYNQKDIKKVNLKNVRVVEKALVGDQVYLLLKTGKTELGWIDAHLFSTEDYQKYQAKKIAAHKKAVAAFKIETTKKVDITAIPHRSGNVKPMNVAKTHAQAPMVVKFTQQVKLHNGQTMYLANDNKYYRDDFDDVSDAYIELTGHGLVVLQGDEKIKPLDTDADLTNVHIGLQDDGQLYAHDKNQDQSVGSIATVAKKLAWPVEQLEQLNQNVKANYGQTGYILQFAKSDYKTPGSIDNATTQALLNELVGMVPVIKANHLTPSVLIAQALLESSGGNSGLAQKDANLFGIKGKYAGHGAKWQTKEFRKNVEVEVKPSEKVMKAYENALGKHNLAVQNYQKAAKLVQKAKKPEKQKAAEKVAKAAAKLVNKYPKPDKPKSHKEKQSKLFTEDAIFRTYPSFRESILDYIQLITTNAGYAGAVDAKNADAAIKGIQAGGYATSPTYRENINNVIDKYDLTVLDK
ncbi:glycoside hydrolase family 73 protein [Periweissella cryptocerci]|nr:glucosaminidase domain-containing protein [Periweissella cryptocerci]